MKGFRVPPQPNKNETIRKLETELANLQLAGRISQMMTQKLMENVKAMSDDLGNALNQVYELAYKLEAVVKIANVDPKQIAEISNVQRLVDFEEAASKADVRDNLVVADVVGADSTIVITSVAQDAKGNDAGIFRSRLKVSEAGIPSLIADLQGKAVGARVSAKLNGLDHLVEVLAIRDPSPQPVAAPELAVASQVVQ